MQESARRGTVVCARECRTAATIGAQYPYPEESSESMTGTVLTQLRVAPSGGSLHALERAFGDLAEQDEATELHVDLTDAGILEPPAVLFLLGRFRRFLRVSRHLTVRLVAADRAVDAATIWTASMFFPTVYFDDALDDLCAVRFLTLLTNRRNSTGSTLLNGERCAQTGQN